MLLVVGGREGEIAIRGAKVAFCAAIGGDASSRMIVAHPEIRKQRFKATKESDCKCVNLVYEMKLGNTVNKVKCTVVYKVPDELF